MILRKHVKNDYVIELIWTKVVFGSVCRVVSNLTVIIGILVLERSKVRYSPLEFELLIRVSP